MDVFKRDAPSEKGLERMPSIPDLWAGAFRFNIVDMLIKNGRNCQEKKENQRIEDP